MAWTTPATLVTGTTIQASWANTHVRDNSRYLKGLDGAVAIGDSVSITGAITTSTGANIGGVSGAATGEVKALAGRFTGFPSMSGGMAVEIGVTGGVGYIQANDRIGITNGDLYLNGLLLIFTISGTEKGRINSSGFSGDGSQLTALNATQVTTGTLPDARISGKNISIFTNNSGYLTAIADNAITTAKIADSNVTTAKIADSNVTSAKIATLDRVKLRGAYQTANHASTSPSFTNGVDTKIVWDGSVGGGSTGAITFSGGTMTCVSAGLVAITVSAVMACGSYGNIWSLKHNGTRVYTQLQDPAGGLTSGFGFSLVLPVNAADTLEIFVLCNANRYWSASSYNYFRVAYLGGS